MATRHPLALALVLALAPSITACASEPEAEPVDDDACTRYGLDDWTLIDGGADAGSATAISLGRAYQVNLRAEVVNHLAFELEEAGPVTLLSDEAGAVTGVTLDGAAVELPVDQASRRCPGDLAQAVPLDLAAGTVVVEIGPLFQASVFFYAGSGPAL